MYNWLAMSIYVFAGYKMSGVVLFVSIELLVLLSFSNGMRYSTLLCSNDNRV